MGVVSSTVAAVIGMTAIVSAGAGAVIALQGRETPKPVQSLDNVPSPITAEEKAKSALLKKRKIQQRTGGKTILASRYGSADDTGKSLLGE